MLDASHTCRIFVVSFECILTITHAHSNSEYSYGFRSLLMRHPCQSSSRLWCDASSFGCQKSAATHLRFRRLLLRTLSQFNCCHWIILNEINSINFPLPLPNPFAHRSIDRLCSPRNRKSPSHAQVCSVPPRQNHCTTHKHSAIDWTEENNPIWRDARQKSTQCAPTSCVSNNNCVVCHRRIHQAPAHFTAPPSSPRHRWSEQRTFCNCLIHHFAYLDLLCDCVYLNQMHTRVQLRVPPTQLATDRQPIHKFYHSVGSRIYLWRRIAVKPLMKAHTALASRTTTNVDAHSRRMV